MKADVVKKINEFRLIAALESFPADLTLYTAEALIKGGIKAIAIDLDSSDEKSERASIQKIAALKQCFGKDVLIGASRVLSDKGVRLIKGAGADFITAPNAKKSVIERAELNSLVAIPGAFTPSEIFDAASFGADFVSLYPSKIGADYSYVAMMKNTFPEIKLVGAGGLDFNDIAPLFKAGIERYIIGGSLANKTLAEKKEYAILTNEAKRYVDFIESL